MGIRDALKGLFGGGPKGDAKKEEKTAALPAERADGDVPEQGRITLTMPSPAADAPSRVGMLRERILAYLQERKLYFQVLQDDGREYRVKMNLTLKGGMKECSVVILTTQTEIESVAVSTLRTAEENRARTAEFMMRVNSTLKLGAFVLDYATGLVYYKCTLSAVAGEPSQEDVNRVISLPVIMFDRYNAPLTMCMMGLEDPKEAFEKTLKKES